MKSLYVLCFLSLSIMAQYGIDDIIIDQIGRGNRGIVEIYNTDGIHEAELIQEGNNNGTQYDLTGDGTVDPTTIIQETPESWAIIEEYGNYNSALLHQKGNSPTRGQIYQDGNWNCAILRQGETGYAELTQNGNRNMMVVDQNPEYNRCMATQSGDKNHLRIFQNYESTIDVLQAGTGNDAVMETELWAYQYLTQSGNQSIRTASGPGNFVWLFTWHG